MMNIENKFKKFAHVISAQTQFKFRVEIPEGPFNRTINVIFAGPPRDFYELLEVELFIERAWEYEETDYEIYFDHTNLRPKY